MKSSTLGPSPVEKDAKKKRTLGLDLGNSHAQQKRAKHTIHTVHAAARIPVSVSRPPVFVPPQMHRPGPTQPITQCARVPQHLIDPLSVLTYGGLPRPHLHSAYH